MTSVASLLPSGWTVIAKRPRQSATGALLEWRELAEAPLRLADARALATNQAIIMAQRHLPDRVELLVRTATEGSSATPAMLKADRA